jgi:hypothetical protein
MKLGRGKQYPRQAKDVRGRVRVYLGRAHPLANQAGQQWRSRLRVAEKLGRPLQASEHVDHRGDLDDDRLAKLRHYPDGAEHNRRHANEQPRDARGRFE